MANFIKLYDTVDFKPIQVSEQQRKDFFAGGNQTKPLIVKIAATHAGLITRNNGFYLPDKMRKGASTFTAQYAKPIQIHHDDGADPVGRVIKAEYVDIAGGLNLLNKVKNNEQAWKDFTSGKMNFISQVNYISDELNRKDSILDDPDFQGAGYIAITAAITDQEAAAKVLDGRYLTGSVGLSTDAAICSVCKQDWVQTDYEERCEHRPGKMYDGKKAFVITGNLNYDEYSFVNHPADRHSRVMEINVNGHIDSVSMDDSFGKIIAVNVITDNITQEDTMNEDKVAVAKIFELADEAKFEALKALRPHMEETALQKILADKHEDADKFYAALTDAEWADYSELEDEALVKYLTDHAEDKKLTPAQRKRLPGSSFCGPNKSFPIPDATHVEATKRLIEAASLSPALKDKILVAVERKTVAFIPVADKKEVPAVEDKKESVDVDAKIALLTEELAVVRAEKDTFIANSKVSFDTIQATVTALQDELAKTTKDLNMTRDELKLTHDDLMVMSDQLIEVKAISTNYLVDKVITLRVLSGEVIEDQTAAHSEMVALGEDAIQNKLTEITAKVDMKKITDSINSGLTRSPTGTIADPTMNSAQTKTYDKNEIERIAQEFLRIQMGGRSVYGTGPQAADFYRKEMQSQGLLPVG